MRPRILIAFVLALAAGCKTVTTEEINFSFAPEDVNSTTVLDSKLERLEKLAGQYPKRSDIPYEMAGVYYQKEDFKESAKSLQRAIYIEPGEAKYHYHLGRIYMRMRELDLAETSFRRSIELMPARRYTGGHAALGYVLCQKGRWDEARAEFEICAGIDPRDPAPHYFLGCLDDMKGNGEAAVAHLRQYLLMGGREYRAKASRILMAHGVEPPPEIRQGLFDSPAPGEGSPEMPGGIDLGDFPSRPPAPPAGTGAAVPGRPLGETP